MNLSCKLLIRSSIIVFMLSMLFFISGCSFSNKSDPISSKDKSLSVIFGYFDMKKAPSWGGVDWVMVKRYKPRKAYYELATDEGLFYHVGVKKGSYQVDTFGRDTRIYSNTKYTYNFGGQGRNETSKIIKKPGVYFLGSYRYKEIDSDSFFKPDNFDMIKTKQPTEKKLLTKLLKIMQNDSDLAIYIHQIKRIKKRLNFLQANQ